MIFVKSVTVLNQIIELIKKEFTIEWRQRNALFSLLLYVGGAVFICYLSMSLKNGDLAKSTWNALFWIIMLFIAINAMAKSFGQEGKERDYYYFTIASPTAIIFSKIIYNNILMLLLAVITYVFYSTILPIKIQDPQIFFLSVMLGASGFASSLTLISGIVSKANNNGTLMAVLSFPILIPILLILIRTSFHGLMGLDRAMIYDELMSLAGINIIVIGASYVLFPYLWRS